MVGDVSQSVPGNHIALQSGPSERVHVSRATPERDPRVTEREEGERQPSHSTIDQSRTEQGRCCYGGCWERSKNKRPSRPRSKSCLPGACFSHPLYSLHSLDNPGLGSTSATTTRRMPMLPTLPTWYTWRQSRQSQNTSGCRGASCVAGSRAKSRSSR